MSFDGAIARPPRCVLVNVSTGESVECLFNPTQLSEKLQVNWNRLAVPGLSHQVLQFQSTANRQLSGVEFYVDRFFAAEQPGDVNILEFRAFLRALTVPPARSRRSRRTEVRMSFDGAIARPPRCVLVNVTSGESMECLFNPTHLSEKLQVNWNRLAVPGLSHQVLQFQSTANRQLSGVEFYLDRYFAAEQPGDVNILEFRAFLRALTVPPEGTEGVATTAPPRVLFIWPEVVTVECVVASVEFTYKQLAVDGFVLVYAASVTFEEILDTRVTSEELREAEL